MTQIFLTHLEKKENMKVTEEATKRKEGVKNKDLKHSRPHAFSIICSSLMFHFPLSIKLTLRICRSPACHLLCCSKSTFILSQTQKLEVWVKLSTFVACVIKKSSLKPLPSCSHPSLLQQLQENCSDFCIRKQYPGALRITELEEMLSLS